MQVPPRLRVDQLDVERIVCGMMTLIAITDDQFLRGYDVCSCPSIFALNDGR